MANNTIINLSDIEASKGVVMIDFNAPWCGPCQMMAPIIDELKKEYQGKVLIEEVNVDENNELSQKYDIMSIPTFLILKDGKVVEKINGARTKEDLKGLIEKYL